MILLGLFVWLAIAGFYIGVTWTVVAVLAGALARRASPWVTRALFALASALAIAPYGCAVLCVPFHGEGRPSEVGDADAPKVVWEPVKPSYLDSLWLSYTLPFVATFVAAWWLCGLVQRRRRPSAN